MQHVIGIDGGGTKTSAALSDINGNVLAVVNGGPTNPNVTAEKDVFDTLSKLIQKLMEQGEHPVNLGCVFAGVSGAGNDIAKTTVKNMIQKLLDAETKVSVEPDPINALYSGTYGEPGIVQISGTGSITYGINYESDHGRVGGWGYLFGDEGSGFDLGRQGIIAALKGADGRGPKTILQETLGEHFQTANEFTLVQKIYTADSPKNEISSISKIVMEAYRQNDEAAQQIITDVVSETATSIRTLYRKLFAEREHVKVVLCGGVFNDREILPRLLKEELESESSLELILPDMPPVGGSIIGALLEINKQKPTKAIIQSITSTL